MDQSVRWTGRLLLLARQAYRQGNTSNIQSVICSFLPFFPFTLLSILLSFSPSAFRLSLIDFLRLSIVLCFLNSSLSLPPVRASPVLFFPSSFLPSILPFFLPFFLPTFLPSFLPPVLLHYINLHRRL